MVNPLSKAAIDRLGERLAAGSVPSDGDLQELARAQALWISALEGALDVVTSAVQSSHWRSFLHVTSRRKTASTLVDKLRRGTPLSSMQDVVGVRVVGCPTCRVQNELVAELEHRFEKVRVVDRRAKPTHGYRAVHVVPKIAGYPVEIQVRTVFQHIRANATESIADTWGRGIRYGDPPQGPDEIVVADRTRAFEHWLHASRVVAELEEALEDAGDAGVGARQDRDAQRARVAAAFRALLDARRAAGPELAQTVDAALQYAISQLELAK